MPGSYVVRFGRMRFLGDFQGLADETHPRGQKILIESDRGTELGEVLCPSTEQSIALLEGGPRGSILRVATPDDIAAQERLAAVQKEGFTTCREFIAQRRLQMDLVDVEAILGAERLVFYYLAERRIDFRDLVRDLARVFRTRIEMRQIGVRDEAKILADYGDCGKPVCCNTHLSRMPPVTMRMAKLQKTTLDPSKISGRCGRLKCCLRYEFDTYQEFERELPRVGARVVTARGQGKVLAQELLAKRVLLEFADGRRILVGAGEIQATLQGRRGGDQPPDPPSDETAFPAN